MPFKQHMLAEFIGKLREAKIVLAQGASTAEASHRIAVSGQTYYRWHKEHCGLMADRPNDPYGIRSRHVGRLRAPLTTPQYRATIAAPAPAIPS